MAGDNKIDISEITSEQVRRAGWATERTLEELLKSSNVSASFLKKLAEHMKVDVSSLIEIKESINEQTSANKTQFEKVQKSSKTEYDQRINQNKILESLPSKFSQGLKIGSGSFESILATSSASLMMFSRGLASTNPVLSSFVVRLGTAIGLISVAISAISEITKANVSLYAQTGDYSLGMQEMLDVSREVGTSFTTLVQTMNKFNATNVLGTRRMGNLFAMMAQQTNLGSDYLMTQDELIDTTGQALEILRQSTRISELSDNQLVDRSKNLISSFVKLSEATGRSREEIIRGTRALTEQNNIYSWQQRNRTAGSNGSITNIMGALTARFGAGESSSSLAGMLERYSAGGIGLVDQSMQSLFAYIPGLTQEFERMRRTIATGTVTQEEASEFASNISKLIENIPQSVRESLSIQQNQAIAHYIAQLSRAASASRENSIPQSTIESNRVAIERNVRALTNAQAALSNVSTAFYTLANDISPVLIPALDGLAVVARSLTSSFTTLRDWITYFTGSESDTPEDRARKSNNASMASGIATIIGAILALSVGRAILTRVTGFVVTGISAVFARGMAAIAGRTATAVAATAATSAATTAATGVATGAAGLAARGGLLVALARGLQLFANPKTLIGLAAVTAAIIGVGFALRLASNALEPFGRMIQHVFEGMGTLITSVGTAISTVVTSITGVISASGEQIQGILDSVSRLQTGVIEATTKQVRELSEIPADRISASARSITEMKNALEGFSPGLFTALSQALGNFFAIDPATKLERLAGAGNALGDSATQIRNYRTELEGIIGLLNDTNLSRFDQIGTVFSNVANTFRQGINTRQVQPLMQVVSNLVRTVQEATILSQTTPSTVSGDINAATIQFYSDNVRLLTRLNEAVDRASDILIRLDSNESDRNRQLIDAVVSSSPRIR